jgi:O-antigen ligase
VGLSAMTVLLYGNYPEWSQRFGRPLNPNFLSFLLVVAFISAAFINRSVLVLGGLLIALIATGSRLPLLFALVWLLVQSLNKAATRRRVALLSLAFVGIGFVYRIQADDVPWDWQIFERSDVWAGRMLPWIEAIESVGRSPFWGQGDRAYMDVADTDDPLRTHNMLLENSVSYGIPASIAAFLVYIAIAKTAYRAWRSHKTLPDGFSFAPMWMYLVAFELGTTLVETSIWTNLGDGGNVLFFLFIGPGLANARVALSALQKNKQPSGLNLQKHCPAPVSGTLN